MGPRTLLLLCLGAAAFLGFVQCRSHSEDHERQFQAELRSIDDPDVRVALRRHRVYLEKNAKHTRDDDSKCIFDMMRRMRCERKRKEYCDLSKMICPKKALADKKDPCSFTCPSHCKKENWLPVTSTTRRPTRKPTTTKRHTTTTTKKHSSTKAPHHHNQTSSSRPTLPGKTTTGKPKSGPSTTRRNRPFAIFPGVTGSLSDSGHESKPKTKDTSAPESQLEAPEPWMAVMTKDGYPLHKSGPIEKKKDHGRQDAELFMIDHLNHFSDEQVAKHDSWPSYDDFESDMGPPRTRKGCMRPFEEWLQSIDDLKVIMNYVEDRAEQRNTTVAHNRGHLDSCYLDKLVMSCGVTLKCRVDCAEINGCLAKRCRCVKEI